MTQQRRRSMVARSARVIIASAIIGVSRALPTMGYQAPKNFAPLFGALGFGGRGKMQRYITGKPRWMIHRSRWIPGGLNANITGYREAERRRLGGFYAARRTQT